MDDGGEIGGEHPAQRGAEKIFQQDSYKNYTENSQNPIFEGNFGIVDFFQKFSEHWVIKIITSGKAFRKYVRL
jgi:hypothetical protein